jgi:hypothetical protein
MMDHGFRIGIVDDKRAFAEAVAAANPRHAGRILGRRTVDKAVLTAPIVLAKAPRPGNKAGREPIHPWLKVEVGEHFDVLAPLTREDMMRQARNARQRWKRRYAVTLATNDDGHSVVRVTRVL